MTALIMGGAGFIGSHIARNLLERGDAVSVFDDFSSGRRPNLVDIRDDIEVIEGDVRDAEAVARAVEGVKGVYHQGAVPWVPRSVADPRTSKELNCDGRLRCWTWIHWIADCGDVRGEWGSGNRCGCK